MIFTTEEMDLIYVLVGCIIKLAVSAVGCWTAWFFSIVFWDFIHQDKILKMYSVFICVAAFTSLCFACFEIEHKIDSVINEYKKLLLEKDIEIADKDAQIAEKISQLAKKDMQISALTELVSPQLRI